jgi:hypothetical protein
MRLLTAARGLDIWYQWNRGRYDSAALTGTAPDSARGAGTGVAGGVFLEYARLVAVPAADQRMAGR